MITEAHSCQAKTTVDGKVVNCMRSGEHKDQDHSAWVNGKVVKWR